MRNAIWGVIEPWLQSASRAPSTFFSSLLIDKQTRERRRRQQTHQDSIRNQEALRGADAVCQIRRQLLKMADVESVDSIASCFLRAAQVESVV